MPDPQPQNRTIADNRKARHDYHIEQTVEAGLVLSGTEIKSIRAGQVHLREAYARVERGEAWLLNLHIAPYDFGNRWNHEPLRPRKLLLHRRQIESLAQSARQQGYTIVPLRLLLRGGRAKVELAVARGKREYDKRASIAEREAARRIDRAIKERAR